jgi:hypothetical protein
MPCRARIALAVLHFTGSSGVITAKGYAVEVDFLEKCQMERSARVICGPHGAYAAPGYEKSVPW